MRRITVAALFAMLTAACSQDANILLPSPNLTVAPATAIVITDSGGDSAHQNLLNMTVSDATGKGVAGQLITLTTTSGTLDHLTVQTGPRGTAQALLVTSADATVTATTGSLTATVKAIAYHVAEPPPPPVFVPPPVIVVPPPPPPPPPPAPVLVAQLTCTAAPHGTPTPCNVNVTYGGVFLPATAINSVEWNWGDGAITTTVPPAAPLSTRTYVNAGTYNIFVTVGATTVDGLRTTTAIKTIVIL